MHDIIIRTDLAVACVFTATLLFSTPPDGPDQTRPMRRIRIDLKLFGNQVVIYRSRKGFVSPTADSSAMGHGPLLTAQKWASAEFWCPGISTGRYDELIYE